MGIRVKRRSSAHDIPAAVLARLRGEPFPPDTTAADQWIAAAPVDLRFCGEPSIRDTWDRVRDDLLPEWIGERPGTRPAAWWALDAPRWRASGFPEWVTERLCAPRLIMVDGEPEEPAAPSGWVPIQHRGLWALPPWYAPRPGETLCELEVESEAAYLRRHGLLTQAEERRADPAEWTTERVDLEAYGLTSSDTPEPLERRAGAQRGRFTADGP